MMKENDEAILEMKITLQLILLKTYLWFRNQTKENKITFTGGKTNKWKLSRKMTAIKDDQQPVSIWNDRPDQMGKKIKMSKIKLKKTSLK